MFYKVREGKADLETKDTKRATQIKTNIVTGKNITFLLYLLSLNWTKCEEAKWWQY